MIKTVFFGTPEFAVPFLSALTMENDIKILGVVTQPDKPVGRKKILASSPIKNFARLNNINVFEPTSFKNLSRNASWNNYLKNGVDFFVVVAYGKIIPQNILDLPKLGAINVHPSLLPKYRGASPIQSAIVNCEKQTGISIMLLDQLMDHGPILAQQIISIGKRETANSLRNKIASIGPKLLVSTIFGYYAGKIQPIAQEHKNASLCKILTREDGKINWSESAKSIDARVRAFLPWPGTTTVWNNKTIKVLKTNSVGINDVQLSLAPGKVGFCNNRLFVGTGLGLLEIINLQIESKSPMKIQDFINGHKQFSDAQL